MKFEVKQFIKKHDLIEPNATIVVGVSGGPDSLALLHFLWAERETWNANLIVAHVDHQLRGDASAKDFQFVRNFCMEKGIRFEGGSVDVRNIKAEADMSTQMAARKGRYQFFEKTMEKYEADCLALGHHGDDQIETILMNQVRGTVGFGLVGIPICRPFATGKIIRPFLGITKEQIEHYCKEEGLHPQLDESNASDKYVRNQFRKEILPFVKKENPKVHLHFQRMSEWVEAEQTYLHELAYNHLNRAIKRKEKKEVIIDIPAFSLGPLPLQRRGIHRILNYLYGKNSPIISTVHIEQVLQVLHSEHPSGQLTFPQGLKLRRTYESFQFSFQSNEEENSFLCERLTVPGCLAMEMGTIKIEVQQNEPEASGKGIFVCDADKVAFPLYVRYKKEGDRISPKGMDGTKKLNRVFIDAKVEHSKRMKWPIVVDDNDDIVFIPFLSVSNLAAVTKNTQNYLVLSFEFHN